MWQPASTSGFSLHPLPSTSRCAINLRLSSTPLALFYLGRTGVNARGTSFTAGSTTQRLPPKKAVRMGDKAKPLAAYRRRLCYQGNTTASVQFSRLPLPKELQNVMAVTDVLARFWQPAHNQKRGHCHEKDSGNSGTGISTYHRHDADNGLCV